MTNEGGENQPSTEDEAARPSDAGIRESRDWDHQFRALVDAVEEYAIFRLAPDGTVVSWNPGAESIKGYTKSEIVGEHFSTFYTEADRSADVPAENLAVAAEHGSVEDVGWRVRADGSRFWANVTITSIRDDDGDLQGYAKVTRDMTDRRNYEERLREERDFVQQILDTAPASIFVVDVDGEVVLANERFEEQLGMDDVTAEVSVDNLELYDETGTLIPPSDRPYRTAFETGESITNWQCQIELPSGERRWVLLNVTPTSTESGEGDRVVVAAQDITQLRNQAEQLEQQRDELEAELSEVFDRVDEAFLALDEDWRITYVNDRAAELVRLPAGELIGSTVWDSLPEVADRYPREMAEEAMANRQTVEFEFYSEILDVWLEIRGYASEGGMSIYVRDVTDRKERERELERTLDLLEKSERIADVGGWEIDAETLDVYWTDHLFDLLGTDADEEPSLEGALQLYHEEDRSDVEAAIENALDAADPFDEVVRIRTANGETRWVRLQGVPVTVDGDVVSLRGAIQDVTERTRRQRRLEELIERLEASNDRLEQFAYAASHDLQEPLRMVSSYLQLIEQRYGDRLDQDGEELLEFAVDGADRMRRMIDGLLQYSRVETQGDPLESVDLNGVLEDVLENLRVKIEERDAEITVADLPRVEGDAGQLRQVFQNLLQNAIEYSGAGPPRVHVSAERTDTEWIVSVTDEGIGIEPEYHDRIFEVFKRLHSPSEHAGTGIGLAVCKRIVERHDGRIWVESEPDDGSTFYVAIPRERRDS